MNFVLWHYIRKLNNKKYNVEYEVMVMVAEEEDKQIDKYIRKRIEKFTAVAITWLVLFSISVY